MPGAWATLVIWPRYPGIVHPAYRDPYAAARELALRMPRGCVRLADLSNSAEGCFGLLKPNAAVLDELVIYEVDVSSCALLGKWRFPALKEASLGISNLWFDVTGDSDSDFDEAEDADLEDRDVHEPGMDMWQAGTGWVALHRFLRSARNLERLEFKFDTELPMPDDHLMVLRHGRLVKLKLGPDLALQCFESPLANLPRLAMPCLRMISLTGFCLANDELEILAFLRALASLEVASLDVRTGRRPALLQRLAAQPGVCPNLRILRLGFDGGTSGDDKLDNLAETLLGSRPALKSVLCRVQHPRGADLWADPQEGAHDVAWGRKLAPSEWRFVRLCYDSDKEAPEPGPAPHSGAGGGTTQT